MKTVHPILPPALLAALALSACAKSTEQNATTSETGLADNAGDDAPNGTDPPIGDNASNAAL